MPDPEDTPPPQEEGGEELTSSLSEEESTGDPWLDKLLSEGVLKGHARLDLAQTCLAGFIVVAFGWLTFSGTAFSPFLLGDQEPIVQNSVLHSVATISSGWGDSFSPIAAFTVALNWVIGGGESFPFQATQIGIHLFNALLVFLLARYLLPERKGEALPMVAGLCFAAHPLAANVVNTLVDRDVLLTTFFILMSLTLYASAVCADKTGWTRLTLSVISFGFAWACGAWAWILPILIVSIHLAARGWVKFRTNMLPAAVFLPLTVVFLLSDVYALNAANDARLSFGMPLRDTDYLTTYFSAWVAPGTESWMYLPADQNASFPMLFGMFVLAGCIAIVRFPRVGFIILWPLIVCIGTSTGLASDAFRNAHIYPASVSFAIVVPLILFRFPMGKPRTAAGIVSAVILLMCAGVTHVRNTDWKDEVYFWSKASAECESCFEPLLRLAQSYHAQGDRLVSAGTPEEVDDRQRDAANRRWKTAEKFYQLADETSSELGVHRIAHAKVQFAQGKLEEALATMQRAVTYYPDDDDAIRLLAEWHARRYPVSRNQEDLRASTNYLEVLESRRVIQDSDQLLWASNLYQLGSYSLSGKRLTMIQDPDVRTRATRLLQLLNPRLDSVAQEKKSFNEAVQSQAPLPDVLRIRVNQYVAEGQITKARYLNEELIRLTQNTVVEDWYLLAQTSTALNEWDRFVLDWPPPKSVERPWESLGKHAAARKQWTVGLMSLTKHFEREGVRARSRAMAALARVAQEMNDVQQATRIYQQMAQENPNQFEPWLALADIAIEANNSEAAGQYISQAEARGASQVAVGTRRSRAGIGQRPVDLIRPSTIQ